MRDEGQAFACEMRSGDACRSRKTVSLPLDKRSVLLQALDGLRRADEEK
jgi:hypothetical protein